MIDLSIITVNYNGLALTIDMLNSVQKHPSICRYQRHVPCHLAQQRLGFRGTRQGGSLRPLNPRITYTVQP